MERMLHRMHRVRIIGYTDLHQISLAELPVDIHIGPTSGIISKCPEDIATVTLIVHHRHRILPLYSSTLTGSSHHPHASTTHHPSHIISHPSHPTHRHTDREALVWDLAIVRCDTAR